MLEAAVANRFIDIVDNGRTKPTRIEVTRENGEHAEVVAKFSGGCDRNVTSLAIEAICAMLAADLNLPAPEPFLVEIDPEFIALIPHLHIRNLLSASDSTGFGSSHLPTGFSVWAPGTKILPELLSDATGILAFDLLIQNVDRRPANPNCLTNGRSIGIFDHEIALNTEGVIGWSPPWVVGGLEDFKGPDKHIFFSELSKKMNVNSELDLVTKYWQAISKERFEEYSNALPDSWKSGHTVSSALQYLEETRVNIEASIEEVKRILA